MSSPRGLRGIMPQRRRGPQANSAAAGRTARHAPLAGLLTRGIHLSSVRTPSGCACGAECTGFLHLLLLEPRNLVKFTAVSPAWNLNEGGKTDSTHLTPSPRRHCLSWSSISSHRTKFSALILKPHASRKLARDDGGRDSTMSSRAPSPLFRHGSTRAHRFPKKKGSRIIFKILYQRENLNPSRKKNFKKISQTSWSSGGVCLVLSDSSDPTPFCGSHAGMDAAGGRAGARARARRVESAVARPRCV